MGRDNSPKVCQRRQLARKQGRRASFDRILIVSEGSKTEPNYFREIRAAHRLPTANVVVRPSELGTEPLGVVQYAEQLFKNGDPHKKIRPGAFEWVFAVFDRDEHQTYFQALDLVQSLDNHKLKNDQKNPVRFQAISSVPCFELWLLLHYEDIRTPLSRNEVLKRLRKYFPDYAKGANNAYATTCSSLDVAIQRAQALARRFNARSDSEPFTAVAALVQRLRGLRQD